MKLVSMVVIIIVSLFSACALQAGNFVEVNAFLTGKVESFGLAGIPWENEYSHDEERARAWMDALHHAYNDILNLPLMEGKLVRHTLQLNSGLKERLGRILMMAPKVFYQPDTAGIIRCKVELPLSGKYSLRSALYLSAMRPQPQEPLAFLASWSARLEIDEKAIAPDFKRIVIDVRDFFYEPSLFPRFFKETGALIFQESMIPETERFSRPAVRFVDNILTAYQDIKEDEYFVISAYVNPISCRDITVEEADFDVFARFCRELVIKPLQNREIVVVFNPKQARKLGKLNKSEEKTDSETKKEQSGGIN